MTELDAIAAKSTFGCAKLLARGSCNCGQGFKVCGILLQQCLISGYECEAGGACICTCFLSKLGLCDLDGMEKMGVEEPAAVTEADQIHRQHKSARPESTAKTSPSMSYTRG